jgi:hypothetical protein
MTRTRRRHTPSSPPAPAPRNNLCRNTLGSRPPTTRHHRHHPPTTRHHRHHPVLANTINPRTPPSSIPIGPRDHRHRRDRRPSSNGATAEAVEGTRAAVIGWGRGTPHAAVAGAGAAATTTGATVGAVAARGMAGAVEVGPAQITGAEAASEAGPAVAGAPRGQRPKSANWGSMTKAQRKRWRQNANRRAKGKRPRFT